MTFIWLGSDMRKGLLGSPVPPAYWAGAGEERMRRRRIRRTDNEES